MSTSVFTGISIILQFITAYLALRLIPLTLTGKRYSWMMISLAFLIMAIEHSLIFSQIFLGIGIISYPFLTGVLLLTTSSLLLAGVVGIRAIFTDLKESKDKLQSQSNYYQTLFTKSASIMMLVDPETAQIIDVNTAACKFYGYTHQELTRKKISDINTLSTAKVAKAIDRAKDEERNFFIFKHQLANGEIRDVEVYSHPIKIDGKPLLHSIIHDVSEQNKTAHALKETMEHRKLIFNATEEGIYGLDTHGNVTFINLAATQMTGWAAEDLMHKNHHARIHHSHADGTPYHPNDCPVHHTIKTGIIHFINTDVFWRKDGTAFPVSFTSTPIKNDEGEIKGAVVTFKDITEAQAIELNTQRLMTAITYSAESLVITDILGNIEYVNPAFEKISGYTAKEAIGQNPRILKSNQHDEAFYKNMWDTITAGKVWRGEFINRKKDNSLYTEDASISPVFDTNGEIINFVAVKRDITHERALEAQYRQSQKMEAIGRLTGGIAHDFNNILQGINGFAELLLIKIPLDTPYRTYAETILKSGQRATALIRQMMMFSRNDTAQPEVVNVSDIVQGMVKMLSRVLTEDIQLRTETASDLWLTKIAPIHAEQVVLNLVVNARDAMPNGGTLTIKTSNIILTKAFTDHHLHAKLGKHVRIEVIDTGIGMSEETKIHIFEPFFTTKAQGKGTGLGLSTVYGIVKQNDGDICFESELDNGTHFNIYFPAYEGEDSETIAIEAETNLAKAEKAYTILVAEDELSVQDIIARILNEVGHTVIVAASGEEALELAQKLHCNFDLLLTDILLPGINGKSLATHLQKQCPNIKVIYMTGYTQDIITDKNIAVLNSPLIEKPFSTSQLLDIVNANLD